MQYILTLIGDPAKRNLDPSHVETARRALRSFEAEVGAPDWLAPDIACDLPFDGMFEGGLLLAAETAIRHALRNRPVDVVAQPAAGRRKRLLLADMDSTVVTIETLDELAAFAGVKEEVAAITWQSMRGEVDFEDALARRVRMIAGLPVEALEETYALVGFFPGAETLVRTMVANGAYTALVSGGFTFFTDRVRERLGFDYAEANVLEIADGRLTGRVRPPMINRDGKLRALMRICRDRGIAVADTLAVGDGANDLSMIRGAGMGVAFRGKPAVAAAARARIDHGDLTALLFIQGYRREEFVGAA